MSTSQKDKLLITLSKNLVKLRNEHNYTQAYVAEKIGISLRTYQTYESKNVYDIRISNVVKIANFYDVTIDSLVKGSNNKLIR